MLRIPNLHLNPMESYTFSKIRNPSDSDRVRFKIFAVWCVGFGGTFSTHV